MFSSITKLDRESSLKLKTSDTLYDNDDERRQEIRETLLKIKTIRSVDFGPLKAKKTAEKRGDEARRNGKIKHVFFDIDSTLTHPGVGTINRNVKGVFGRFMKLNCFVYFCTGRSSQEVENLIKMYETSPYGIAENGGIILGSNLPYKKLGDRKEPDKFIRYLNKAGIQYSLDPKQQSRKTEHIILRESLEVASLKRAIRKSKIPVEVHSSKNTYHISKERINKGAAIMHLSSEEELSLGEDHEIIAVGDSDLDIPMFEVANSSYAVGNADPLVKKKAKYTLKSKAPEAVEELYNKIFKYG